MPPKKKTEASPSSAAASSGPLVPPPVVTLQEDGNGKMRVSEVKIYLGGSPTRDSTSSEKTEKPKVVTTKSGRQVRSSKKPVPESDTEEKDPSEYEADEEEEDPVVEPPKRKGRGTKRSYDDDSDYGKKKATKGKAPAKKATKAPPAKGRSTRKTQVNSSDEDEEEAGEKGFDSDSDEETSNRAAAARKRPNGRMVGAPPSARLGQKKRKDDSD